ncbi:MAG: rRNA maturation RNase YbeY [Alphaproteobacteria bacterium]|nr:rRNA maturation RNase YbeY [Alphaproteobacteria bacterium]
MSDRIAVLVANAAWRGRLPEVARLARRAARAALRERGGAGAAEVAILLADDAHVRELNRRFRRKDKPTNVLSFPAGTPAAAAIDGPTPLGDIVLAFETCAREAREQSKTLRAHMTHLVVHGVLHLLGHDHVGNREAERMEALERAVLARLSVRDPYASPPHPTRRRAA